MGEYVNSQNARFDKSLVSCGVMEMHHLPNKSPSHITFALANALYHKANPRPAAFIIFSDVVDSGELRGKKLAEYLKTNENEIGILQETSVEVNPKTGNKIQVWILTVNHDKFRNWYKEELANRMDE